MGGWVGGQMHVHAHTYTRAYMHTSTHTDIRHAAGLKILLRLFYGLN